MDFDLAVQRLASDQRQLRARTQRNKGAGMTSATARREATIQKQEQERLWKQKLLQQHRFQYAQQYMRTWDRGLGVLFLGGDVAGVNDRSLQLQATSIYGDGDKIALPVSILERLTQQQQLSSGTGVSDAETSSRGPWTFRIGIRAPDYVFPASARLQQKMQEAVPTVSTTGMTTATTLPFADADIMQVDDNDEDDDIEHAFGHADEHTPQLPYLEELSHKYLSYTHGTVVEFTQDEGHVGLPRAIATALLDATSRSMHGTSSPSTVIIPAKRTVDPSRRNPGIDSSNAIDLTNDGDENEKGGGSNNKGDKEEESKTAGHLAWGAFDVPDLPVEITLVRLPKAKACTLVPTQHAIEAGFYKLRDIKMVLEQSLVRTRATLSVGDRVHTWHRGVKYDLTVRDVDPATYQAVTCINTDMEVQFGSSDNESNVPNQTAAGATTAMAFPLISPGFKLGSSATAVVSAASPAPTFDNKLPATSTSSRIASLEDLPREPPIDSPADEVITIQIRGSNGSASPRRRFWRNSTTLQQLFDFARVTVMEPHPEQVVAQQQQHPLLAFRLVTRFPRTVWQWTPETATHLLHECGDLTTAPQELFLVERIDVS